jgi:hypothetical protein
VKIAFHFLLLITLLGCAHQNRIECTAASSYYPHYPQTEREWRHIAYEVYVAANTPPNRRYAERTHKTLYVALFRRGIRRCALQYDVVGAAIDWEVTWRKPGHATLHVYDFADHVTSDSPGAQERRHEILTIHYDYDEHSESYLERRPKSAS